MTAVPTPQFSLRIGSSSLGWEEFGANVLLGQMDKAMPGGDGSLVAAIPFRIASQRRNVLRPMARVILTVSGAPMFSGRLLSDPLDHAFGGPAAPSAGQGCQLQIGGMNAVAARNQGYACCFLDNDVGQWLPDAVDSQHFSRFQVTTDAGYLSVRAPKDTAFDGNDGAFLVYARAGGTTPWQGQVVRHHHGGGSPCGPYCTYRYNLSSYWQCGFGYGTNPAAAVANAIANYQLAGTSSSGWTNAALPYEVGGTDDYYAMGLWFTGVIGTPAADEYFEAKLVAVSSLSMTSVYWSASTLTVPAALMDMAQQLAGSTSQSVLDTSNVASSASYLPGLVVRPEWPKSMADGMLAVCNADGQDWMYWWDTNPAGVDRFNVQLIPATPSSASGNRRWIVDTPQPDIIHDCEVAPDYVIVTYCVTGDATFPDGTVMVAQYPATAPSMTSAVQTFDYRDTNMLTANALTIAQNLYNQLANTFYSGDVVLPPMVKTVDGDLLPSWFVRPGDRIDLKDRDDGDLLYVSATSFDWSSLTGTATVGWPGVLGMKDPQTSQRRRIRGNPGSHRPGQLVGTGLQRRYVT